MTPSEPREWQYRASEFDALMELLHEPLHKFEAIFLFGENGSANDLRIGVKQTS